MSPTYESTLKRLGLWLLHYWEIVKPLRHGALLEKADLSRHVLRNIYSLFAMKLSPIIYLSCSNTSIHVPWTEPTENISQNNPFPACCFGYSNTVWSWWVLPQHLHRWSIHDVIMLTSSPSHRQLWWDCHAMLSFTLLASGMRVCVWAWWWQWVSFLIALHFIDSKSLSTSWLVSLGSIGWRVPTLPPTSWNAHRTTLAQFYVGSGHPRILIWRRQVPCLLRPLLSLP